MSVLMAEIKYNDSVVIYIYVSFVSFYTYHVLLIIKITVNSPSLYVSLLKSFFKPHKFIRTVQIHIE